jgi:hypothetical protein
MVPKQQTTYFWLQIILGVKNGKKGTIIGEGHVNSS